MRQFQLRVSGSQLCFYDNRCWHPEKEVRQLKHFSTLNKYLLLYPQHRPLTSPTTKMLLKVAVKIHLDTNYYYLPGQVSRRKNGWFLRADFILTSGSQGQGLFFQNEDGDRQRRCAKYMLFFHKKNTVLFYNWCHFAVKN